MHPIRIWAFGAALTVASWVGATMPAWAQFGGTQDMMLQKQQQRLEQITRGNRPTAPSLPAYPTRPHYPQRPTINQFYFQSPGYVPYGYYDPYPYPYPAYPGYGYYNGPLVYPPNITVVPHGVPLSSEWLNGSYGSPPLGAYAAPPVVTPQWIPRLQSVAPEIPAPLANAAAPANVAPLANAAAPPNAAPVANGVMPEDEIKRRVKALKPSTETGRLRSDELIAEGDREFAAQQYRKAAAKYREAITKAPDYAPGLFRTGHAYIATGDYELAVTYLAMGFELARTAKRPGFTLTDLYQGNQLAKEQHLEALADAVLRQPTDGGLLFLTGVFQHYDGKPLQARDYFRRAAELPGRHQSYAQLFLPAPNQAAANQAAANQAAANQAAANQVAEDPVVEDQGARP